MKIRKAILKIAALCLALSLSAPYGVRAAVMEPIQPLASDYLTSYNTYVCAMGSGRVEVWFTVVGVADMDDIGTLRIMLYESTDDKNWTWVKTFSHEDYPSMLAHNDFAHCSCVSYQGVAGRYYKAYVCIWAGQDGRGDARYIWTISERAT